MCACTGTVNKAGDTPLSLAYKGGHWEVVKYLAITHHCDTTSNSDIFFAVVNDLLVFYCNYNNYALYGFYRILQ